MPIRNFSVKNFGEPFLSNPKRSVSKHSKIQNDKQEEYLFCTYNRWRNKRKIMPWTVKVDKIIISPYYFLFIVA